MAVLKEQTTLVLCFFLLVLGAICVSGEEYASCQGEYGSCSGVSADADVELALRAWSDARGVESSAFSLGTDAVAGAGGVGVVRGAILSRDVSASDLLLRVPAEAMLTPYAAQRELRAAFGAVNPDEFTWPGNEDVDYRLLDEDFDRLDGMGKLCLTALHAAFARIEPSSSFHALLTAAPRDLSSPVLSWTPEELEQLQASRAAAQAASRKRRIERAWVDYVQPLCTAEAWTAVPDALRERVSSWCSEEMFQWGVLAVTSRTFRVLVDQKAIHALVPWADMMNTAPLGSLPTDNTNTNTEGGEAKEPVDTTLYNNVVHLMANNVMELRAQRDLRKGESLLAPYGQRPLPNAQLLLDYGFVMANNSNSQVSFLRPMPEKDDPIRRERMRMLTLVDLEQPRDIVLDLSQNVEELLAVMRLTCCGDEAIIRLKEERDLRPDNDLSSVAFTPLTTALELEVVRNAELWVRTTMSKYGTSPEEDLALLANGEALSSRFIAAIQLRLLEKEVLRETRKVLSERREQLQQSLT